MSEFLTDLPDDIIIIIAEYVTDRYVGNDKVNLVKFYAVNKRLYQLSNYYVIRRIDNSIYLFPSKSWYYKCSYEIVKDTLINYSIWTEIPPTDINLSIGNGTINIWNKNYHVSSKDKCEELLKVINDIMPNYMKVITKPITLFPYPFPLFEDFIYSYLKL